METARIAQILDEMGTMLEINGENPFRCRAYHTAAQSLMNLPDELSEMIADGRLAEVPGHRRDDAREDRATGDDRAVARLRRAAAADAAGAGRAAAGPRARAQEDQGPARGAEDREPGRPAGGGRVGADRRAQGVRRQDRGEDPRGDRVRGEDGRSDPPEPRAAAGRRPILEAVRGHRAGHPGRDLRQPAPPGRDDRRPRHPVQLEDIRAEVLDAFVKLPQVATVLGHGPTKASVRLADGVQCDLRGVEDDQFAFALHYFTGSKAHNIAMRKRALARGLSLNEYALAGEERDRSPAGPRPSSSRRSGWPRSRPSCARTPASSRPPRRAGCPTWSSGTT